MNFEKIGENIDEIRKARKWTKAYLAERVGTQPMSVCNHIKTGKMSLEMLGRYVDGLGCTFADLTEGTVNPKDFNIDADIFAWYPYNLIVAVFSPFDDWRDKSEESKAQIIDNVYRVYVPGFLEVLKELTDREQRILKMRFENLLTLEQVGREFGVTRDRIRQIEAKAIRKLRSPTRVWKYRFDTLEKAHELEKQLAEVRLKNVSLNDELERLKHATGNVFETETFMNRPEEPEESENVDIEDLELSVRSFNCLRRAGIYTVNDLRKQTINTLMKTRNLGRKSLYEILHKLKERGITLEQGDE